MEEGFGTSGWIEDILKVAYASSEERHRTLEEFLKSVLEDDQGRYDRFEKLYAQFLHTAIYGKGLKVIITRDETEYSENLFREGETGKVVLLSSEGQEWLGVDPMAYIAGEEACKRFLSR